MWYRRPPVRPTSCPVGFKGSYTVKPGDTLYKIAHIFQVGINALVTSNPHIPDPNILMVGDALCVPESAACSMVLNPKVQTTMTMSGIGAIHSGPAGGKSFTLVATLPPPKTFGERFEQYTLYLIHEASSVGSLYHASSRPLSPVTDVRIQGLWASRIDELASDLLARNTKITVSATAAQTPPPPGDIVILEGDFGKCSIL